MYKWQYITHCRLEAWALFKLTLSLMTNFRIHIVPSPRASSHFLGDQLSHSYSTISKGKLTLPWWPPSHSYHTISKGRTSSKTAGIDLELDFELNLVYNNFWATTLELEAFHYCNNLPENIRVWGRHIISSSIVLHKMGFQGTMPLFFFVFFHWVPQKNKDFFGFGYCMGEHPWDECVPRSVGPLPLLLSWGPYFGNGTILGHLS